MNPLHKAPAGLLELYRLKTLGEQPNEFGRTVQAVVESKSFYSLDVQFGATHTPSNAAFPLGRSETLTAGPIELRACSLQFLIGAAGGTYLNWRIALVMPTGSSTGPATATVNIAAGNLGIVLATQTYFVGLVLPQPLMLPAGASIIASGLSDAAGADHQITLSNLFANLTGQL